MWFLCTTQCWYVMNCPRNLFLVRLSLRQHQVWTLRQNQNVLLCQIIMSCHCCSQRNLLILFKYSRQIYRICNSFHFSYFIPHEIHGCVSRRYYILESKNYWFVELLLLYTILFIFLDKKMVKNTRNSTYITIILCFISRWQQNIQISKQTVNPSHSR